MKKQTLCLLDLLFNAVCVLSTVVAIALYYLTAPDALGSIGSLNFAFFTTESNILVSIPATILVIYDIRRLGNPELRLPKWLIRLKFAATTAVALTFLTVALFLAPMASLRGGIGTYFFFFAGNTFFLHFSTPVLASLSFILFEREHPLRLREAFWGLLPTVAYSIVYVTMVAFLKLWPDWYGFTFGGNFAIAPFSLIGMYLVTYGIAVLLLKLRRTEKTAPDATTEES